MTGARLAPVPHSSVRPERRFGTPGWTVVLRGGALFGLLGGAFAAHGAPAEPVARAPAEWLRLMNSAFRELDYHGVFTYYTEEHARRERVLRSPAAVVGFSSSSQTSSRLAAFQVFHTVVDGVEHERIVYLNGPPREILRTGDRVACVLQPEDRLLALEGALPSGLYGRVFARDFTGVDEHYEVVASRPGRVAGRRAVGLDVIPRDAHRFGYKLWLDEQTGLLLKSELRDTTGAKLEIFAFTTLAVGDRVPAAALEPALEGALVRHLSVATQPEGDELPSPAWSARWVPPGFRMTGADIFRPGDQQAGVHTLRFSDGLAAFSVFVEPLPKAGAGSVVSRAGATVALTHLQVGAGGDHLVTMVGEVPVDTARRIAAGVSRAP